MKWYTYDAEVFAHDFLIGFKDRATGEYTHFHNDNEGVREFITDDSIYCGFNTKGYDQYIIKAIVAGFTPEEVKAVNDWIIAGNPGWKCPLLNDIYYRFNNVDIMDDMQMGLSLKAIEGHLGLNICESEVDFSLDRPLKQDEIVETIGYNDADIDATENVTNIRKNYLNNKIYLGGLKGIEPTKALAMTNAKLTAAYLDARRTVEYNDEREYKYPDNLIKEYIPQEVFDFFNRLYDKSIPDDELFKSKLNIYVGDCPVTLGYGGIHGAIPFYQEEETESRIIRNYDVASYYPHLMVHYNYTSRNIPNPQIYADMLKKRMAAKKAGDTATAEALKLVANTTYGAMLNQYNDLYDPLMGRSVCITGQLFLLELSQHLIADCSTLKIVQLNTDGIMVSFDKSEYEKVLSITKEWQERTKFELEEDKIKRIVQKDVNNYIELPIGDLYDEKGNPRWKIKGGYLVRGIPKAGAFNINNNATIIAKAIVDYFVKDTPVEYTINNCDNIFEFQIIAKAGAKYKEAYHLVDGEKVPVQKVNRVYAAKDEKYGKIYKVKSEDNMTAKIESLPEHCIIDNDNTLTIVEVDKTFYIDLAKKRINDYLGIKPEKKGRKQKMAEPKTTKVKNVYQKLLEARVAFIAENVKKSGKNMQMAYKYFELDDIVPVATPIFNKIGLLPVVTFDNELAKMTIIDVDSPENTIVFTSPMKEIEPIISSRTGGEVVNAIQRLGSVETYQRRYLYMIALDIVEADSIEPLTGSTTPVKPQTSPTTDKSLTDSSGNATELQIKQMKELLKKLRETDSSQEEWIAQIAVDTKGFTTITKANCEQLIKDINTKLDGGKE